MLRSIEEIPRKYRHIFEKFANFNRMQSEVIDKILHTDKSIVVSAPTGSGKTVILELAIVRLLKKIEDSENKDEFKIIYIAPIKALCNEITADWKSKFDQLNVLCGSVTGDDNDFDLNTSKLSIIVTTPEKFDSLSRKWNACDYMRSIKLLMIDEVHLLNDEKRGPILEAVVSRMKTIRLKLNQQNVLTDRIRFVAVSATIPNISDLASWLDDKDNTIYHKVSEDLRPVKLERHVLGYPYYNSTPFRFDMNLTYKLPSIIEKYSNSKPTLIFCSSRRSAEMGATTIIDKVRLNLSDEQRQKIIALSTQIEDAKLCKTINRGVAFHHAGLCVSDKKLIEECFRSGSLPILFSTNTLAMGVNLPAYLSVIKSTEMLVSGAVHELSEAAILQMIGRAGRPQFDDHGVAVIMTQNSKVKKYESLISGTSPIESHLHNHLTEHLNSEIVSQTISNMDLVAHWIRSSYLYIRAIQKPLHYGFPANAAIETVEQKLEELCVTAIDELEKYGLITRINSSLKATQLGRLMAHFYLNFDTMKHFTKIIGTENLQEIFGILITCPDFSSGYHLRVNDKRFLNELNKSSSENDCIRFPIQGKVKTVTDKISCLMQAILGNIPVTDSSITEEATQLVKLGQRIGRALQEYIAIMDVKNNFSALVSIILLLKSLHANLWENSPYVFKQFNKIGHVYSKVFSTNGKTTFESVLNSTSSDIEMILKKRPPFGKEFLDGVSILPQFTIDVNVNREEGKIGIIVKQINAKFVCDSSSRGVTLIVGDSTNETLFIDHRVQYFLVKYGTFERTVPLKNPAASTITVHLIHNGIVGLDKLESISLFQDEQSEAIEDPEPIPVPSLKRKSDDQNGRPVKQCKISDYLTSPKKAQKRKSNHKVTASKAKTSQSECDRQMEIMENDGIGVIDLTEEVNSPEILNTVGNGTLVDTRMTIQGTIDFLQRFKKPSKNVFKFVQPTKPLDVNLNDNNSSVEDIMVESENVFNPINTKLQATDLSNDPVHSTKVGQSKTFTRRMPSVPTQVGYLNEFKHNERQETRSEGKVNESETKEDNKKVYVPSCIKAMFGSQTTSQKVQRPLREDVLRKKDINFSYDHLLTPVHEPAITSNSQSNSLCGVIEGQHKLHRAPLFPQSPTFFPFHNFHIKNFCAAKELERIDRIDHINKESANDNGGSLFSLEYDAVPSQRSIHEQLFVEPIRVKDQPSQIVQQSKVIDITTPITLNEHKYSKRNYVHKKMQIPQTFAQIQSPNDVREEFQRSQKLPQKCLSTQHFYNHLQNVSMTSGTTVGPLKYPEPVDPFINFNNRTISNDWFESSRRTQQRAPASYSSSSFREGFIPTQSNFHW